jgi:hypothetical protein
MIGVAGIVYTAYFVKEKIEETAKDSGIDLGALAEQGQFYEPCSLLSTQEAAEILSVVVERSEAAGDTCNYFIRPPSDEEKSDAVAKAMESFQQQSGESSPATPADPARPQGLEDLTKAWVGSNVDANTPYFTIQVHQDGNAMMAGMKIALLAGGGTDATEQLQGLGDQAVLGPLDSLLIFVKDGTGIQIDLRQVAEGRDRGIQLARRILARM